MRHARHRVSALLALLLLALLLAPSAHAQSCNIINLGTLGGTSSQGCEINASGQTVGYFGSTGSPA